MLEYQDFKFVKPSFNPASTLAENRQLKSKNETLTIVLIAGVIVVGLVAYHYYTQEQAKKIKVRRVDDLD
jgi:type VI protein secretion system component VasF